MLRPCTFTLNGRQRGSGGRRSISAGGAARGFRIHFAEERLRAAGFVRLLHAVDRRQAAALLHDEVKSGGRQDRGHAGRLAGRAAAADCRSRLSAAAACSAAFAFPAWRCAGIRLSRRIPIPSRAEIAHELRAHLCRCTGYVKIVDAIEELARVSRGEAPRKNDQCGKVGTSLEKYRGNDLVLGDFQYIDDITVPGMSYAAMKFSRSSAGAGEGDRSVGRAGNGRRGARDYRGRRAGRSLRRADRERLADSGGHRRRNALRRRHHCHRRGAKINTLPARRRKKSSSITKCARRFARRKMR